MIERLSAEQWRDYDRDGFVHLGPVLTDEANEALRRRADDLALGVLTNPLVQFQRDTGGRYEDLPAETTEATRTHAYRKVQGLENDDLYRALLTHPVFVDIAARHYGAHASVSLFRAMIMNKPAGQGTTLPWHQDGGDVWALDRDPLVTTWVALDAAGPENGCIEVIPGSHRKGLLTAEGSTLSPADADVHCPPEQVHALEVPAGHAVLLHNWLLHRSGVNPTGAPRRAFTACYMDARTRSTLTGSTYPVILGAPSASPTPYLDLLVAEREAYRTAAATAEEYALSLQQDNALTKEAVVSATAYARSLEAEIARRNGAAESAGGVRVLLGRALRRPKVRG